MEAIGATQNPKLRLLFVEDNPADAELALKQIQKSGFEVTADIVQTPADFRSKLASGPYDIILSDLALPNWSGLDALEILKQTSLDIPFIMVTGTVGEETVAECLKLGATDYVLKDRPTRLPAAMRRALQEKALREERKRAEERLQEYEKAVESLDDMILVVDREYRYVIANRAYLNYRNITREQLADHAVSDFLDKQVFEEVVKKRMDECFQGNAVNFELRIKFQDLGERDLAISYVPIEGSEGIDRIACVLKDITERKRAEAEHIRLITAIEQAAESVVVTDAEGRIEYVNPAFSTMTGYSREEVLGQNSRILKSGKHDATFYAGLWAAILAGQVWMGEMINRRKDGSLYTEKMSITPVHNEHGEMTHFVAMKEDITARKLLEDQFRQAQKMEAVGRLAAGVAHDFNNLLTIIIGYSDLVLDQFVSGDPRRAYATEIKGAGERAVGLTRQLLAFSRQQVLTPQVLDLNSLIANLTKLLSRLIGEDIDLVFNPSPCPATVKADPGLIEQVLMNLTVNGRDAMPRGGKLTIETSCVQLEDAYSTPHFSLSAGHYIMLAVSDTGCGMDKDTQAHMFEPFFTTKEQGKGTGLGLATVYGIVKQSGGNIWVYSEPGAGTTFKIYLPAVTGTPEAVEESPVPMGGSETVLLVEDDAGLRELARMVLVARGGYKVLVSIGSKEAQLLAEQQKGPIHLLLTDIVMPGMSGRELSERLAALHPEMKILYMSGYTDDTAVRHGVLEEGMAFLQKPFTAESLLRKVRDVLDAPAAGMKIAQPIGLLPTDVRKLRAVLGAMRKDS